MKRSPLERRTPLARKPSTLKRGPVSPASPGQRAKVTDRACVVCAHGPSTPAHLIDRSLGGDDDPRAVVPLCFRCHRAYDDGTLSLLEYLEPRFREELAYAVELVGLLGTLRRVTNTHWVPA
jgi:hypothetical protein